MMLFVYLLDHILSDDEWNFTSSCGEKIKWQESSISLIVLFIFCWIIIHVILNGILHH